MDQGEVVMMGEEYQCDLLHPAWAPGAVVPLPSFTPNLHYTLQYGRADSNGDFFTPPQPRVSALAPLCVKRAGRAGHVCTAVVGSAVACQAAMLSRCPAGDSLRAVSKQALPAGCTLPQYDPVPFRARSWLEPTSDLQHPQVGGWAHLIECSFGTRETHDQWRAVAQLAACM